MRIHPADPGLFLVEVSDLAADPLDPRVRESFDALTTVLHWAGEYLAAPHPELGRSGAVCPFAGPSIAREAFFLAVVRGRPALEEVERIARAYRAWYPELEPREGRLAPFRSVNLLFPDVPEDAWETLIGAAQERLKGESVAEGLMIGEFHPGPPRKAALWNPDFRPLRSPVPLLSIRQMVPTDWVFLRDRQDWASAYLRVHGGDVPAHLAADVGERAAAYGLALPGTLARIHSEPPSSGEALTPMGA
jgi:hypothetical protein